MLPFSDQDLNRAFDRPTRDRGQSVYANQQVMEANIAANGELVLGAVRGSEGKLYRVRVAVRRISKAVALISSCSCPVVLNCKHGVALLMHVLANQHGVQSSGGAGGKDASEADSNSTPAILAAVADILPPALDAWLTALARPQEPEVDPNAYPDQIRERLLYVLAIDDSQPGGPRAVLRTMATTLLKSGAYSSNARQFDTGQALSYAPAKHLRSIDMELLRDLNWLRRQGHSGSYGDTRIDARPGFVRLLEKILETGRCHWQTVTGPKLTAGPSRTGVAQWLREAGGRQRLGFVPTGAALEAGTQTARFEAVLPTAPLQYIDLASGEVGLLDVGLPDAVAAALAEAPVVAAREAQTLARALETRLAGAGLADRVPKPDTSIEVVTQRIKPKPRLELFTAEARVEQMSMWSVRDERHRGAFRIPLARVTVDYGGTVVEPGGPGEVLERDEGNRLIVTPRDRRAEGDILERVEAIDLVPIVETPLEITGAPDSTLFLMPAEMSEERDFLEAFDNPSRFVEFSMQVLPGLAAEGWEIIFSDDYPYRVAEGETKWWADIGEGSGIDWFSFELGVEFDGHRIDLIPTLADVIARLPAHVTELGFSSSPTDIEAFDAALAGLNIYHQLPDRRILPLPAARIVPLLRALLELIGPRNAQPGKKLKLSRASAAGIAALADAIGTDVAWAAGAERLVALGRDLQRGRGPKPVKPPATFKANLRDYQSDGLAWLDFLRDTGFGGVLADDMGLGKTVQALAFLANEKAKGRLDKPALIIAPTSVLPNWMAEAERFTPNLKVLALRGLDRHQHFASIGAHDVVLTTYPLLARDHEALLALEFHVAILDEAQAIKNPRATVSGLAHRINARHRLALTGTPLENNLGEVWSLFQYLSPGLLGDEQTFRRTFRTPIEKHGDKAAQAFLTRRLKPFMLRRTKQEVAKDLPPKTEIIERIRLEGGQRDLYETVRALMLARVRQEIDKKGLAKSHIIFLDALLKLRQVCCDPRLLKMPQAAKVKESAKLERLMEMLPELVGEGRRILLFSQFTTMLGLIETELEKLKIPFVQLTGDTVDRAAPVKQFQSGKVPVFLLSLKAGGTGLNLTAADTVIHYDPWWNPAVENQATDRAYRIGQDKPVFVHKLIVEEGIEQAIEILKARKAALATALFEGASKSGLDLTEADIAALFAPLEQRPMRKAA